MDILAVRLDLDHHPFHAEGERSVANQQTIVNVSVKNAAGITIRT